MPESLSPQERVTLLRTLNKLPSSILDEVRIAVAVPKEVLPGENAAQGHRSSALIDWADSPVGCGTRELKNTVDDLVERHKQELPKSGSSKKLLKASERVRQQLIEVLQTRVEIRLKNSLHNLVKVDLNREEQRRQVGQSPQLSLVEEDPVSELMDEPLVNREWRSLGQQQTEVIPPAQPTLELFDRTDIRGRFLILGEPGSGKTTELLMLLQDLLERAKEPDEDFIPVIVELSSWKPEQSVSKWMCIQLDETYRVAPKITQEWIANQQLVLLLDGLDELGITNQVQCIEVINTFLHDHPMMQTVVCCRREEYEQGKEKLTQLNGAIYLQPITDEQIQGYLRKLNRSSLWPTLQSDSTLLEFGRTPLFLTMLVVSYQGKPIHTVTELFDLYIAKQLNDPNNQGTYPPSKEPTPDQTQHYLSWLAQKLEAQNETEFLIERLQPSWLADILHHI